MYFTVRRSEPEPEATASILADLPDGLVLPRDTDFYLAAARDQVTYLARSDSGDPVGVLLLEPHFHETVEVHLMAVRRAYLRQGIGRRLLAEVEADARAFGTRLIEVKTIGPSDPNPGAAASRVFYQEMGFLPVEEIHGLWDGHPALIQIKII